MILMELDLKKLIKNLSDIYDADSKDTFVSYISIKKKIKNF
jgi:hypothetical protein